jgi:hypothetical protein
MTESDYRQWLAKSVDRFRELSEQRQVIEIELVKLRQFIDATMMMVDEKEREKCEAEMNEVIGKMIASSASLANSVRRIFDDHPYHGLTASAIRTMLLEAGFDFSFYTSNPLSSISTTLRRMAEMGEVESRKDEEGTTIYFKAEDANHPAHKLKRRKTFGQKSGDKK